jgi:hypothetical protein
MALSAGFRLGPYEVLAPLGAGGLGEVHRRRDPRLEREIVANALPYLVGRDGACLSAVYQTVSTWG